jgi:Holliday junction DNA helicase RuvB
VRDLAAIVAPQRRHPRDPARRRRRRAIASRSRGTPRVANRLLKRVRDYAEVRAAGVVTAPVADAALRQLEIDDLGLDRLDREILNAVCEKFGGGPVGLSTLAVTVGEEQDTIEDVYEPYLLPVRPPQAHGARPRRDAARLRASSASSRRPDAASLF